MGAREVIEPLYVCVYVPEISAQALARLRPELAKTPVVILAGDAPLEQVCSYNALAGRLGVERGMTRAELDVYAGLRLMKRSLEEERIAKAALLDAAAAFTPRIEIQAASDPVFAMVLDMAGTGRMFGSAQQSVRKLAQSIRSLNLHPQFAAAANFHAAVTLAPAARQAPLFVAAGKERETLSALPVSALPLTSQQVETFHLWGLQTLGELAALPEVELVARLGQEGKRLRQLARGEHAHLLVPEEPSFELEEFVAFDAPVELLDSLLFVLGPMLDQLLTRAQNRAFALASVTVKLVLDGGGEHERTIKPALPVLERTVLLKLLHLDLQANPPSAGVMSVHVHAEPGDRSKVQLGLFTPQLPEPMRLDVTLARIAALVGQDRVGYAKLQDAHKPDSFVMERFSVPAAAPKSERKPSAVAALRRYRPPLAVTVKQQGDSLASFTLQGKPYIVKEAYGPWRRSGEWWSASLWSMEEWDVHAESGQDHTLLCVLTHDLLSRQWQMTALYD